MCLSLFHGPRRLYLTHSLTQRQWLRKFNLESIREKSTYLQTKVASFIIFVKSNTTTKAKTELLEVRTRKVILTAPAFKSNGQQNEME